ncbi:hypothetical protein KFE25_006407 [Diacronema lutheri]|uniref:CPW-WPC domain-containing protein n=1 Tax=Diacronema lutheri TaxID=2081491 RepID=A0A8J5XWT4_DIALT|nr:hypothetical protein KFE25_006407 [Diacronema lutheri]
MTGALAGLDLFAKTDERVRERTALGGAITVACVVVLVLSAAEELALMRAVERSTRFSAFTSRERRSRMQVHLEMWFPALGCNDLVVDVTDDSGSQTTHMTSATFTKERTDGEGRALGGDGARPVGPVELPSLGMGLRRKIDSLALALHEVSVARACSPGCTRDVRSPCPLRWTAGASGECVAPAWYAGPCAGTVRFAPAGVASELIAEMVDECEVDWPCTPPRVLGADAPPQWAADVPASSPTLRAPSVSAAQLEAHLRAARRVLRALANASLFTPPERAQTSAGKDGHVTDGASASASASAHVPAAGASARRVLFAGPSEGGNATPSQSSAGAADAGEAAARAGAEVGADAAGAAAAGAAAADTPVALARAVDAAGVGVAGAGVASAGAASIAGPAGMAGAAGTSAAGTGAVHAPARQSSEPPGAEAGMAEGAGALRGALALSTMARAASAQLGPLLGTLRAAPSALALTAADEGALRELDALLSAAGEPARADAGLLRSSGVQAAASASADEARDSAASAHGASASARERSRAESSGRDAGAMQRAEYAMPADARAALVAAVDAARRALDGLDARHGARRAHALHCVFASIEQLGAQLGAASREHTGALATLAEPATHADPAHDALLRARERFDALFTVVQREMNSTASAAVRAGAGQPLSARWTDGTAAGIAAEAAEAHVPGALALGWVDARLAELEASLIDSLHAAVRGLDAHRRVEGCTLAGAVTVGFAPGRLSITPGYRHGLVRASRAHHAASRRAPSPSRAGARRARRESLASHWWNASHVVRRLSIGEAFPGQRAPLERAALLTRAPSDVRYGLTVVPTEYEDARTSNTEFGPSLSFEYSATRHVHELGCDSAHDRLPGVHFAWEISPLKLRIVDSAKWSASACAVRLLSIGGNLFVVGQVVDRLLHLVVRLRLGGRREA